jgi:precorrin-3B synthase
VFSTHAAADGHLARIRLPGGEITGPQLAHLARAAAELGDGHLELTARANIQLRGITDVDAVAEIVLEAGLVPSATHEKVRNIAAGPLSGRIGGIGDVRALIAPLDEALRADDRLASLSGRFLFGLDDGRGDILRRDPDVCAVARMTTERGPAVDIVVAGETWGSAVGTDAVVAAMLGVAREFAAVAGTAWRISDLDAETLAGLGERARAGLNESIRRDLDLGDAAGPVVGWFDQDDGAVMLGAVVELARIPSRLAEFLAAIDTPIIITPDREILTCDLSEAVAETVVRVLAPMGLIFDAASPWALVSCCAGAPGCASGLAPVRDDLLARVRDGAPVTEREHWVGCGRGCGSPATQHLRVEAEPDGYRTHPRPGSTTAG